MIFQELARCLTPLCLHLHLLTIYQTTFLTALPEIRCVIEGFYVQLQSIIDKVPKKDILIVQGDWNAKVGADTQADWQDNYRP